MKKIVALLICALLIAALAIPVFAAEDDNVLTISSSKTNVKKGDEFVLTFSMTGSDKFVTAGVELYYDTDVFELVRDGDGVPVYETLAPSPWMILPNDAWTSVAIFRFDKRDGTLNSDVCSVAFRVIADCPSAEYIQVTKAGATNKASESIVITASGVGINVTGEHDFGAWTPNGENHVHTCSKCGAEETGAHNLVKGEVTQQPNCTVEGKQNATCSDCGLTTSVSIPTNDNHSWNAGEITTEPKCGVAGVKTYTCQHNAEHTYTESVPALEHKYDAVVTAPTCTEKGYTTYTCSLCGNSYMDTYVPATGHKMGQWVIVTDSTCTAVGEERSDCSACDHFETREIPVKAHDYVNAVVTAPTCTEKGFTTRTCVCGASIVDTYVNPTGHKMGDWTVETPATCEATGTERSDCANCDHSETRTTKALGHDYESKVTTPATCKDEGVLTYTCKNDPTHTYTESIPKTTTHTEKVGETVVIKEPTCTEKGISSGVCAVCGVNMDEFETAALGHDMGEWYVKTDSTCTAVGEMRSDCSRCDHSDTKVIDKKEHTYEAVVTNPTCTKNGFTTHTCSVCGNSYDVPGDKALGHEYTSEVTTAPGCETEGVKTFTCVRGDHSYTEAIPATGHSTANMEVTKAPTCEEDGVMSGKCSVCGKELSNEKIPAIGHDYELTEDVAPTCTEKGHKTYVCKNDASHTKTEESDALGHTFGDWIKVDAENHKHVCACGHEETAAHKWDTGKVTVEPTHTATGVKTYECKDCHATREEELPKVTKHEYTAEAEQIVDEEGNVDKTYHTGICACGETHKEKHSYDIWGDVIKEPTSTAKGEQEKLCACGHKIIVKIKAEGTLDDEPGTGDITDQVVMTGVAAFSMMAAAAYVFIRKRTA